MIMEYQKMIDLLDNTSDQPSKFRTRNWVERNDDRLVTCKINSQIRLKTIMLKSRLGGHSDSHILVKETVMVPNTAAAGANVNNVDKKVLFKTCAPFTDTQVDYTKDIDAVIPMYNLIEYSNNYSKASLSL